MTTRTKDRAATTAPMSKPSLDDHRWIAAWIVVCAVGLLVTLLVQKVIL